MKENNFLPNMKFASLAINLHRCNAVFEKSWINFDRNLLVKEKNKLPTHLRDKVRTR
jgi:hypothetical protein